MRSHTASGSAARSGWPVAAQTGAALAGAMGVGRFVFTPILPLMEAQAHLTSAAASTLATSNYLGYLVGALLGITVPRLSRTRLALRVSGIVLIATLLAVPLTHDVAAWAAIRGLAGVASAVIFMVAGNTILTELTSAQPHILGWAYGGVGAASPCRARSSPSSSRSAAGRLRGGRPPGLPPCCLRRHGPSGKSDDPDEPGSDQRRPPCRAGATAPPVVRHSRRVVLPQRSRLHRRRHVLVAAISATGPSWLSSSVWVIVGAAAVPSCAAWTWLSRRVSRPTLITGALLLQAVGIALPALTAAVPAALAAAVLFGATFIGITTLSLATGRHLRVPRAVAVLTAGYAIGQVLGPLVVEPTLHGSYRPALLVGSSLVLGAAMCAALLRIQFPHHGEAHHRHRNTGDVNAREAIAAP